MSGRGWGCGLTFLWDSAEKRGGSDHRSLKAIIVCVGISHCDADGVLLGYSGGLGTLP